jgi:sulfide:quinone oxidoreductase
MKRIVVLGGGTGGTIAANQLRRIYDSGQAEIVVADEDDTHIYQPPRKAPLTANPAN